MKWMVFLVALFAKGVLAQINPNTLPPTEACRTAYQLWQFEEDSLWHGSYLSQKYLDSAITLCPEFAEAWREKGEAFLRRGDYAIWKKCIDQAVKRQPNLYLGYRGWCRFVFLRDYEGTLCDLMRLDTLVNFEYMTVQDMNICSIISLSYLALGDYPKALLYLNRSLSKEQQNDEFVDRAGMHDYLYRGILKMKTQDYTGAITDFDEQIRRYETYADAYYYKALVLLKLKKKAEARTLLYKTRQLINGEGFRRQYMYVELPYEIYSTDIEEALLQTQ